MDHFFNTDCQVTTTGEPTQYSANISKNWSVGDAPNGGYLMALAISSARKAVNLRDPLSMTAYYLNKTIENAPVEIEVKTLNQTKSNATVSISFTQQGVLRSQYMGTFGTLSKQVGVNYTNMAPAPELPHPDDCVDISAVVRKQYGDKMQFAHRIEYRSPKDDPFVIGAIDKLEVSAFRPTLAFVSPHNPKYAYKSFFHNCLITEQNCVNVLLDPLRQRGASPWHALHGAVLRRDGAYSRHDALHLGAHHGVHGALLAAP